MAGISPQGLTTMRAALLAGTALILPGAALAQQPQGGQVVAGSASISRTPGQTTINQSTDRAAIDWRTFNIGRDQTVQFQQPGTGSVTLNRVTTPDPSQIAGSIIANGQIAIVNQSGVVFHQGSQVNAAGLVVSTANISNEAFMRGGRMAFDQPGRPDARIENNGTITVREAGLAALVAPQVANRGTITARMGRVVLAGAETSVVDFHGDGLLSLEITSPVRQAPTNGEALVTNTGTITATGGTVQLTASAVDGIVQDLVRAGGRISADTDAATGRTGRVVVSGTGGAVRIEGEVSAQGLAAGTRGGDVQILGDRTWIAPGAVVNASGRTGGGTVALGVTPQGAPTRRLARRTGVAQGAVVRADATESGNGGTVLLNSAEYTVHAGVISVQGGPQGGNGGFVEVSSAKDFRLLGEVNVAAGPGGLRGTLLIDPTNLTVVAGTTGSGSDDGAAADGVLGSGETSGNTTISNGFVNAFAGNLRLQATNAISVDAAINKPTGDLSLEAGGALTVSATGSIVLGAGDLNLTASSFAFNGPVTVPFANSINLTAAISGASISQTSAGILTGGTLTQTNPSNFFVVALGTADNAIDTIGSLDALSGSNSFRNTRSLTVSTSFRGNTTARIDVSGGDLTINGTVTAGSTIALRATGNFAQGATGSFTAPDIILNAGVNLSTGNRIAGSTAGMSLTGTIQASTRLNLNSAAGGITQTSGSIQTPNLVLDTNGSALLNIPVVTGGSGNLISGNDIRALNPSTVGGQLALVTQRDIQLQGLITVSGATSIAANNITQAVGGVLVTPLFSASTDVLSIVLGGDNQIDQLGNVLGTTGVGIRNARSLLVSGIVRAGNAAAGLDVVGDLTVTGTFQGAYGATLRASGSINLASGSVVSNYQNFDFTATPTVIQAGYDFGSGAPNPNSPASLTLGGFVGNPAYIGSLTLAAGTGGIRQTGGRILATNLTVQSGGDALLNGASASQPNSVETLLGVTAAGNFVLDNGTSDLSIGTFGGSFTAQTFSIRTAGNVEINAPVIAVERATFRVGSLFISAPFSGPAPGITAPLVEIAPDAAVQMGVAVGDSTPPPFVLYSDIFDQISTSTLRLGATTFGGVTTTTASEIFFTNSFSFPGTLDVRATGDIFQTPSSTLGAGTLTGAAGGSITLVEPTNVLPVISDLSAGTALSLRTTGVQTLTGTVSAPSITLTTGGALTESGAGRIAGGTLGLQTGGSATLLGANAIIGLAGSNIAGALQLNNTSTQLSVPVGNLVFSSGALTISQFGDLVVDGTVSGASTLLSASGRIQVNGNSAIARTGDLNISSSTFGLAGLLQASGAIRIAASNSATLAGRVAAGLLRITSPSVAFGGLNASGTPVELFLGTAGSTSGTLDARALSVYGGASASLFGSIAGIGGGAAAAAGRRGTASGTLLNEPLPQQDAYLFNNCQIGVAVCVPIVIPSPPVTLPLPPGPGPSFPQPPNIRPPAELGGFVSVASSPLTVIDVLRVPTPIVDQLRAPLPVLNLRPFRDRSEEADLAPPNIRGDDF
ncbi:MAG: hypothetical protein JWR10_4270 [Rubritepida sp.]|nr:hypothetical protein [Rubritepida sp.]